MTTEAVPFQRRWLFSLLWTNVAVALVDLVVFAGGPARPTRELVQGLTITFVYANLTSVLALLMLGWLMQRLALFRRGRS